MTARPTGAVSNQEARLREEALRQAVIVYSGAVPLGEAGVNAAKEVVDIATTFEHYLVEGR